MIRTMANGREKPPGGPKIGAGWMRRILFAALDGVAAAAADSVSGGSRWSADASAVSAATCSPAGPATA